MIKKSIKSKSIFKGAVFGIAVVMCGSFVPVAALHTLADELTKNNVVTDINNKTNRIEIDANSAETVVEKGNDITIPVGVYYGQGSKVHTIGNTIEEENTITESKVVAYYKADDSIVYDSSNSEKYTGNKFKADRIGTYVVEYIVVDSGMKYSHKIEFKCTVKDVEINFDTNSKNIIPSIYDLSLMDEKKDIVLPIPTVEDEDGNVIKNLKVYLEGEEASESEYLKISLDNAYSSSLKIEKDLATGNFVIKGDELAGANGHEFKIVYKYYQNGVQVKTAEKSFKVYNEYYKQKDNSAGYTLAVSKSAHKIYPVVGVAESLPTITVTTSSSDSPSSESVEFSYEIKVNKEVNGVWQPVEDAIDKDNNFIVYSEGDYQIVYVVTDFYGHTQEAVVEASNVKDNIQATPYVYDGADKNAYDAETNTYKSAESILKSQSVARNIIVYAIGGTDNAVEQKDITLTREIRSSNNSTVIYKITDHNEYNLIFQPLKDGEKGLYKSIYDDNYQIRRQMILGGTTATDEETIKNWLKNNNYRIVVNDRVTSPTGDKFNTEGTEATDEELEADGFVYIEPNSTDYKFSAQTYSIYYIADDNFVDRAANELHINIEIKDNVEDAVAPSILYSTELQTSYLSDDVITLKAPTASDNSGDSKVEIHTAYRYLDSSKLPITEVDEKPYGSTISYLINDASKSGISSNKWYIQEGENRIVTSYGWTLLEGKDEYTIKLKNKPNNAAYIEFFSYAIDDSGNVGFYDKQIYVSTISDTKAPTLFEVVSPEIDGGYVNNDTIILPTLKYQDNLPQYMNAGVVVYKVDEENQTQTIVHASNMSTYYDSIAGNFVVEAGSFNASTGGKYLVAVTVNDIGNHSITTYFTYDVQSVPVVQDPEITNIGSTNKEIVVEKAQSLPTPKLSVSNDDEIGFVGLSDDTTETLSDYYTVSVISASDSDGYKLSQNSFTATAKGTYKLQYNVFLISYSTQTEYFDGVKDKESATRGYMFLMENENTGRNILAYKAEGGETLVGEGAGTAVADEVYYIFLEKNTDGTFAMRINTETTGQGKELDASQLPAYNDGESTVKLHSIPSSIITYTAGDIAVNLNMDESAYEKTKYETLTESITILPINADADGAEIDKDKSTVSISVSTGNTTRTIASVSINDWYSLSTSNNSDISYENGNLKLALNTNGKYTIKYTVKAIDKYGMSVGSEKTISYEISVGDVIAPEITIDNTNNQFIKSTYEIGDKIDFKLKYIDLSDNKTDEETLGKNLVIQIKNTSLNKTYPTLGQSESFEITENGNYTVSIYVKDSAGNSSVTREFTFSVGGDSATPINVTEVVGKVLIAVSAVILGGVIVYFIVSKAKESKKKR